MGGNDEFYGGTFIPAELKTFLQDFTICYLIEKPSDIIEFGFKYFSDLISGRMITTDGHDSNYDNEEGDNDLEEEPENVDRSRRNPVFATASIGDEEDDTEIPQNTQKTDIEKQKLIVSLKTLLLFRNLDDSDLEEIIDKMFVKDVTEGQTVIKQGEPGDNLYIIDSGNYDVIIEKGETSTVVKTYKGAGFFGELALMYNTPRACTIKAVSPGKLWGITRRVFKKTVMQRAIDQRNHYGKLLHEVPLLKRIPSYQKMDLADALVPVKYTDGQVIIQQGDAANGMYFVEKGTVAVSVKGAEHEIALKTLGPGQYFGELALVTDKPRAATVTAVGSVKLAFLDAETFNRLLGSLIEDFEEDEKVYKSERSRVLSLNK